MIVELPSVEYINVFIPWLSILFWLMVLRVTDDGTQMQPLLVAIDGTTIEKPSLLGKKKNLPSCFTRRVIGLVEYANHFSCSKSCASAFLFSKKWLPSTC